MDTSPVQPVPPRSPVQPQTTPIVPPPNAGGRGLPWVWLGLGAVLVIIVIVVLVFSFRSGGKEETTTPLPATPSVSPTPTATPTPKPSPSPTVNPADWTFEVLNGSEVNGAAAKAAQILRERGYTVKKVDNADKSTYEETQLLVTAERSETAQALLTDLKTAFPVDEVDATLESDAVTARLIIGKDWQPPTTSPKASPKTSPTTSPK